MGGVGAANTGNPDAVGGGCAANTGPPSLVAPTAPTQPPSSAATTTPFAQAPLPAASTTPAPLSNIELTSRVTELSQQIDSLAALLGEVMTVVSGMTGKGRGKGKSKGHGVRSRTGNDQCDTQ